LNRTASSRNTTAQPRQPAPVTNTVSQPRQPAPATTTASQPRQPAPVANTRPPASVTNTRQPAPATPATTTASQPRQPAPATNTASQRRRPVPVTHAHDSSNVSQTSTSTVLDNLDLWDPLVDNLDFREPLANDTPSGAPPSYTPSFNNPDPAVRALSQQALQTQLTELETALRTRKKGSISIRPYTSAGNIDAVQLVYIGLTQLELTDRELGTPVYLDPSFSTLNFSGGTTFD
jgi:hypothetical protein